jgi:hypothetical protein
VNKIKKIAFSLATLILYSCISNKHIVQDDSIYYEIHFQNFFLNDTINFNINNRNVFEKLIITSDSLSGFANVVIQAHCANGNCTIKYKEKIIDFSSISDTFYMGFRINNKEQSLLIDLKKGNYIGLNKNMNSEINVRYSGILYEYD